jgi:uncharacterized membrane protein YeiH
MIAVLEAIGVGCFAVAGSAKALHFDAGILASIIIGVLSATFGGIVSDALASRDTVLARKDIYVTAALVAALIYNVLLLARVPDAVAAIGGAASGASLRLVALRYGWLMPSPRGRKLRSGE